MANEKRLIDANKFEKLVLNHRSDYLFKEDVIAALAKQPTVDAVEVVHGEWSTIEDDYCGLIALRCSECNAEWWFEDSSSFEKYSYCPNCGAKMDK